MGRGFSRSYPRLHLAVRLSPLPLVAILCVVSIGVTVANVIGGLINLFGPARSEAPDTSDIAGHIREHGWSVSSISEGDREIGVPFSYSIGLHEKFAAPEIIITGLSGNVAANLINLLGEKVRSGAPLPLDIPLDDLLEGGRCCMLKATAPGAKKKLGMAYAYYRHWDFQVIQCVWPDPDGLFPWKSGCTTLPADQPLLIDA